MITIPSLPTERDEELVRQFRVTLNYLRDLEIYLQNTYGRSRKLHEGIATTLASHRPYLKLRRRAGADIDLDQLQRHLEIAWVSELELWLPAALGAGRALRVTNAWSPVHAYYATAMLLQAWFDANGMTGTADDHTAALRSISAQIKDRRLFPLPWSILCEGNAHATTGCTYVHEPSAGACAGKIQVLSMPIGLPGAQSEAEFFARFGTWLRTTRKSRLEKREEQWKRKEKKGRIDPQVRKQFVASLHPTSLFPLAAANPLELPLGRNLPRPVRWRRRGRALPQGPGDRHQGDSLSPGKLRRPAHRRTELREDRSGLPLPRPAGVGRPDRRPSLALRPPGGDGQRRSRPAEPSRSQPGQGVRRGPPGRRSDGAPRDRFAIVRTSRTGRFPNHASRAEERSSSSAGRRRSH